mmetsp:Transcript_103701/g.183954  ORF Transcript_103701/g.183954 Transcript_103701/m.183954 type:complete len:210 (+) Transcript_103701:326-955(+)
MHVSALRLPLSAGLAIPAPLIQASAQPLWDVQVAVGLRQIYSSEFTACCCRLLASSLRDRRSRRPPLRREARSQMSSCKSFGSCMFIRLPPKSTPAIEANQCSARRNKCRTALVRKQRLLQIATGSRMLLKCLECLSLRLPHIRARRQQRRIELLGLAQLISRADIPRYALTSLQCLLHLSLPCNTFFILYPPPFQFQLDLPNLPILLV